MSGAGCRHHLNHSFEKSWSLWRYRITHNDNTLAWVDAGHGAIRKVELDTFGKADVRQVERRGTRIKYLEDLGFSRIPATREHCQFVVAWPEIRHALSILQIFQWRAGASNSATMTDSHG
jgi:hypothetical protein